MDKNVSTNNHNSQTVATPQSNANLVTNEQHNIDNTISSNTNLLKTNCNDGLNYLSSLRSAGPSMMTNVDAAPTQLSSSKFPNQYGNSVKLKPQNYDGTEDLDDYLSQFEILADLNCWNYETKSFYLAGSLKGDARTLLTELSSLQRRDYDSLVQILTLRFGSLNRAEIYKAKKRRDESISELAQSIKKLTRQAYPNAPASVTSTLARDHFIDALPDSDVRLRIRETQAKDIAEAEILALRLEAYRVADRQKTNRYRGSQVKQIGSNECVDTENNSSTMVKIIMDGFRHEFKSLSNDIKQVVKASQDKPSEKDKNNGYIRPHNGHNQNWRNPNQDKPNYNNNNRYQNNRLNTGFQGRSQTNVEPGNRVLSNTGASVRQNGSGPTPRLQ